MTKDTQTLGTQTVIQELKNNKIFNTRQQWQKTTDITKMNTDTRHKRATLIINT